MDKEFKKYFEEMENPPPNLWKGISMQLNEGIEKKDDKQKTENTDTTGTEEDLKHYFDRNRTIFNEIEEPPKELWQNIQTQLTPVEIEEPKTIAPAIERKSAKIRLMRVLKVAMIFVVAFGLGWFFSQQTNVLPSQQMAKIDLKKMAPEVAEAEAFYLTNIVAYKNELKDYEQLDNELVQEFLTEHEQLDNLYDELKEMLHEDVDNDQILNLMIQNLQMRMAVLEKQKTILRNIQQQKKLGNDKTLL